MKSLAILAAVALAAAFIPIKAPAKDFILNVSGTIKSQSEDTAVKGTTVAKSFNEKTVYSLITNALAGNYGTLGTNFTPTNMPPDGYIAFSTNAPGTNSNAGTFYVTNKSTFYYPLSGLDNNGQYYSFIELDTYVNYGNGNEFNFGYGAVFSDIVSDSLNINTGNGSGTGTAMGTLYIHDNPYAYNDADDPDVIAAYYIFGGVQNENAIEIRGLVTTKLKYTAGAPMISSFSLTGTGNSIFEGNAFSSLISSGHATLSQ